MHGIEIRPPYGRTRSKSATSATPTPPLARTERAADRRAGGEGDGEPSEGWAWGRYGKSCARGAEASSLGRPHLARALQEAGHTRSVGEAFDLYLKDGGSAFVETAFPTVREAIDALHAAGGVAVWAHPELEVFDREIRTFRQWGLNGIECFRPHDAVGRVFERWRASGPVQHGGSTGTPTRRLGDWAIRWKRSGSCWIQGARLNAGPSVSRNRHDATHPRRRRRRTLTDRGDGRLRDRWVRRGWRSWRCAVLAASSTARDPAPPRCDRRPVASRRRFNPHFAPREGVPRRSEPAPPATPRAHPALARASRRRSPPASRLGQHADPHSTELWATS